MLTWTRFKECRVEAGRGEENHSLDREGKGKPGVIGPHSRQSVLNESRQCWEHSSDNALSVLAEGFDQSNDSVSSPAFSRCVPEAWHPETQRIILHRRGHLLSRGNFKHPTAPSCTWKPDVSDLSLDLTSFYIYTRSIFLQSFTITHFSSNEVLSIQVKLDLVLFRNCLLLQKTKSQNRDNPHSIWQDVSGCICSCQIHNEPTLGKLPTPLKMF